MVLLVRTAPALSVRDSRIQPTGDPSIRTTYHELDDLDELDDCARAGAAMSQTDSRVDNTRMAVWVDDP